ncbi:3-oxosteroid 1-dehydrogenase [Novosphingobium sp. PhB165]|uniref:FAD-dependent oxidoreductase n=1 Tax=Novosphingobium sp. PhB165 TaxID=2485105 RepID=UPI0010440F0C|nr:FAD-dependent oxidoreductase [Novosphingobium sp. PhB165]TCM19563.1 3-oxosteroid 1-dehydrogenase [Novosphingobium sp. PhB165]
MPDIECDVLIVGSGIGGLTAAIAARMAGLDTLVIEQDLLIGGPSSLSSGMLWMPNSQLMIRDKVHDSRSAALDYLANFVAEGDRSSTPERRAAFVDGVAPLVALYDSRGIPLHRCEGYPDHYDTLPGGHAEGRAVETSVIDAERLGTWRRRIRPQSLPIPARASELARLSRATTWEGRLGSARLRWRRLAGRVRAQELFTAGAALQARLLLSALELGAEIRTRAALMALESERGRVTGAMIDCESWHRRVRARHGVVIASGRVAPNATQPTPGEGAGDAVAAMEGLGAGTAWMSDAWRFVRPASEHVTPALIVLPGLAKPHLVIVDAAGGRFVNEAAPPMEVGRAVLARESLASGIPAAWAVLDARHRVHYRFGPLPPGPVPRQQLQNGTVVRAASLDALAHACGIDPAGLEATVTRWNALAARGEDSDFAKGVSAYNRYYGDPRHQPNPCMGSISRAPFFAIPLRSESLGTCGGVLVDAHARVLRDDGRPITGLYAIGGCTAPLSGPNDIAPGFAAGVGAVFGMIAVRHMVG